MIARQNGRCACGCGDLSDDDIDIQIDHLPALWLRQYDEATRTYTPAANDPDYMQAMNWWCHLRKTSGSGATTRGTDVGEYARQRRRERTDKKLKRKIPSRPFPKRLQIQ